MRPVRSRAGSGCRGARAAAGLTASPAVDYQAGYEAMNTMQSAFFAGANVVWQSAGWLEGGLVTSLAKFVADAEVLDLLLKPVLAARGGRGEPGAGRPRRGRPRRALLRLRAHARALSRVLLAPDRRDDGQLRSLDARWQLDHAARAENRVREILDSYARPPLDDAIEEELVEFVERRAVELGDPLQVA